MELKGTKMLYKCKNDSMEQITYEELAKFALNGQNLKKFTESLKASVIFEAQGTESLEKFMQYLEGEKRAK